MSRLAIVRAVFAAAALATAVVMLSPSQPGQAAETKTVTMMDACSDSFNDMFGDGVCERTGGVPVETFLKVLEKVHSIGSWGFNPGTVRITEGMAIQAYNAGGEVHTFTEVDDFGGGFLTDLNDLTDSGPTVPECVPFFLGGPLAPGDFIPPGGKTGADVEEKGTHKYQCCIHPWMKATVTVR